VYFSFHVFNWDWLGWKVRCQLIHLPVRIIIILIASQERISSAFFLSLPDYLCSVISKLALAEAAYFGAGAPLVWTYIAGPRLCWRLFVQLRLIPFSQSVQGTLSVNYRIYELLGIVGSSHDGLVPSEVPPISLLWPTKRVDSIRVIEKSLIHWILYHILPTCVTPSAGHQFDPLIQLVRVGPLLEPRQMSLVIVRFVPLDTWQLRKSVRHLVLDFHGALVHNNKI